MTQSYHQFADIIDKFPFYNLKFDKNFLKYCKKLKENYALFLKTEKE